MAIIPLTKGFSVIVDDEDFEWLNQWKWQYVGKYAARFVQTKKVRKIILMHRLLVDPPEGLEVDHINRNKLDNRRANLRAVNRSENMKNRDSWISESRLTIWQDKSRTKQWIVISCIRGEQRKPIARFMTREEAEQFINMREAA
jgi:hypothetical protein